MSSASRRRLALGSDDSGKGRHGPPLHLPRLDGCPSASVRLCSGGGLDVAGQQILNAAATQLIPTPHSNADSSLVHSLDAFAETALSADHPPKMSEPIKNSKKSFDPAPVRASKPEPFPYQLIFLLLHYDTLHRTPLLHPILLSSLITTVPSPPTPVCFYGPATQH